MTIVWILLCGSFMAGAYAHLPAPGRLKAVDHMAPAMMLIAAIIFFVLAVM